MLRPKSPQTSFYGSYLYDRIIPQDHLLRKINATVDFSFIHDLVKDKYTPDFGRPAEDPEFMLRLCLLQYLYGDSDRAVIENARMHNGYKYFLGLAVDEDVPDDTTVCYFRAVRLGEETFRKVFEHIVQQCIDKGLVTGKRQIVDSTHIVADIAINSLTGLITLCRQNVLRDIKKQNHKVAEKLGITEFNYSKQDKFARQEEHLNQEVTRAKALLDNVTAELKRGSIVATDYLKRDLDLLEKAAVADRIDEAVDRLVSPVDSDARLGKKEHKHWAGYKGHLVIEEDTEIITALEITPANKNDGGQLKPLLNQQEQAFNLIPKEISGDKAYDSGANLELLDTKGITGAISLTRKLNVAGADLFTVDHFQYDTEHDTLSCPAGQTAVRTRRAVFQSEKQKRRGKVFQFNPAQCTVCTLKDNCHRGTRGRAVYISYSEPLVRQMKARMESEEGQEAYRNRYRIEHKIADLARYCGMRRCRYRTIDRARIHTLLAAIVANVKRMARLLWKVPDPVPCMAAGSV